MSFPLDAYAMNQQELNVMAAAQQLVFAKCALGGGVRNAAAVEAARKSLALGPDSNRWLFGHWDAPYVAAHSVSGPSARISLGGGEQIASGKLEECVNSPEMDSYLAFDFTTLPMPPGGMELFRLYHEAVKQTYADPRFVALVTKRKECLRGQGYKIDPDSDLGSVDTPSGSSSEISLKADLAEAKCSDDLGFQQQAADIFATYQQLAINAHQAQLVAIRKQGDERVARATALLRTVGLG
jgi:hypothetical protein